MVITEFLNQQEGQFIIVAPPTELTVFTTDKNFIRTFPHQHDMEGSFAAKMQKTG